MMWSSVPKVRSGMRTLSFRSLSIWKACGVVPSGMRCRPIRSWVWPDGSVRTVCASHTLSSSVRAMGSPPRAAYRAPPGTASPAKRSARMGYPWSTIKEGGFAMTPDLNVVATLEALNRGYLLAAEKSDVAWYAKHLAEDYMATNPDGSLVDRAGFLARIGRPY